MASPYELLDEDKGGKKCRYTWITSSHQSFSSLVANDRDWRAVGRGTQDLKFRNRVALSARPSVTTSVSFGLELETSRPTPC
jgi:hypothetical protein